MRFIVSVLICGLAVTYIGVLSSMPPGLRRRHVVVLGSIILCMTTVYFTIPESRYLRR